MSTLITGKLPIKPKTNSEKKLTWSIYYIHWLIKDKPQNLISKIAKKQCHFLVTSQSLI